MSAAEALQAAHVAGIRVEIDGDDLVLEAMAPPPSALLDLLSRHKAGIVELLRPTDGSWSAEDWRVFFEERAGIAEFDGGLARGQAEVCAFECCVAEWLRRNPVCSLSERCVTRGGVHEHKPLLPRDTEGTDRGWLHARCGPVWRVGQAEAVTALSVIGIAPPADLPDDFGKNRGA
jgi:hypothetical protein